MRVCTIIKELIPVDCDIVSAWDVFPGFLVFHRELRRLLGLRDKNCIHNVRCEGANDNEHNARDEEANGAAAQLLPLLNFILALVLRGSLLFHLK